MDPKTAAQAIVTLYARLHAAEPIIRYAKAQASTRRILADMEPAYEAAKRVLDPEVTVLRVGENTEVYACRADALAEYERYLSIGVKARQMVVRTVRVIASPEPDVTIGGGSADEG